MHVSPPVNWSRMPAPRVHRSPQSPRQARSRRTYERLPDALDERLKTNEWRAVTVEDIVETAAVSVGTFYKRFASKDELLAPLIARTEQRLSARLGELLQPARWRDRGLRDRIDTLVDVMIEAWTAEARLVRAARSALSDGRMALPATSIAQSRQRMQVIADWLLECAAEIRHPDPRAAVSIGLYFCLEPLQNALSGAVAGTVPSASALAAAAQRMLYAYLVLDANPSVAKVRAARTGVRSAARRPGPAASRSRYSR